MEAKGTLFILSILLCSINTNGGWAAKSSCVTSIGKFTLQDLSENITIASSLGDICKGASHKYLEIILFWACAECTILFVWFFCKMSFSHWCYAILSIFFSVSCLKHLHERKHRPLLRCSVGTSLEQRNSMIQKRRWWPTQATDTTASVYLFFLRSQEVAQ